MKLSQHGARRWRNMLVAASLSLLGWGGAQAGALPLFAPFSSTGNVSVFDAAAGTGGWVGALDGLFDPASGVPLDAVQVVLFALDASTLMLSGSFEISSADLTSTLVGTLSGSATDADVLLLGGQFDLDYAIVGGSGLFAGASGFGLSFLDFDPQASVDNYVQSGVFVFTVPEPGSAWLAGGAMLALLIGRGRRPWKRPHGCSRPSGGAATA